MADRLPTLCLDFDGVIHSYESGWTGAGHVADGPVPGAVAFLATATKSFDVAVFSSRSATDDGVLAMAHALGTWLRAELGADEGRGVLMRLSFPRSKPPALVTLDDRALTFTGEWPDVATLAAFVPWNKKKG